MDTRKNGNANSKCLPHGIVGDGKGNYGTISIHLAEERVGLQIQKMKAAERRITQK